MIPSLRTNRLVGVELEYDASGTRYREPARVEGWTVLSDGSLRNGREYVMDPPRPVRDSLRYVTAFCSAATEARTNVGVRGGFHVHVQSHDLDIEQTCDVARLYSKYQNVIDRLLPVSRRNCRWAARMARTTTPELVSMFNLNTPASSRGEAKSSRKYTTVNLAMCRCRNPDHRSIEFRQGASTKRIANVMGWTALVTALVETVAMGLPWRSRADSAAAFENLLKKYERETGSEGLVDWVNWRREWINQPVTRDLVSKAITCMRGLPRGVFHVSRELDVNVGLAKRICNKAVEDGKMTRNGNYYTPSASCGDWLHHDLQELREAFGVDVEDDGRGGVTATASTLRRISI